MFKATDMQMCVSRLLTAAVDPGLPEENARCVILVSKANSYSLCIVSPVLELAMDGADNVKRVGIRFANKDDTASIIFSPGKPGKGNVSKQGLSVPLESSSYYVAEGKSCRKGMHTLFITVYPHPIQAHLGSPSLQT